MEIVNPPGEFLTGSLSGTGEKLRFHNISKSVFSVF